MKIHQSVVRRYLMMVVILAVSVGSTPWVEAGPLSAVRRINAPHFDGLVQFSQMAVTWFGRVTQTDNYIDVRVGYNNTKLVVLLSAFDRSFWFDESPTSDTLTAWDGATLYLNLTGNSGTTLTANAYRFDGQVNAWDENRLPWQTMFRGSGSQWQPSNIDFNTESGQNASPNNDIEDRGWRLVFNIPFTSLGFSGPPPQGTVWGIAIASHDRDSAAGPPNADKTWPESFNALQPATWGQVHFGLPVYTPPVATPQSPVIVRQGLNGAVVVDGMVGGGSVCGDGADPFTQWGDLNYAGYEFFNVQNQEHLGDWPCFSKYFVTFPLTALPAQRQILSATLTLRQFGNAGGPGWDPPPEPSFIQVLSTDQAWDANTLTWNNAPVPRENFGGVWVNPLDNPGWPGVAYNWDVSSAVAEAYATGGPLRLAVYSADSALHSGRYFYSSNAGSFEAEGRPTLTIVWGNTGAMLRKTVWPPAAVAGKSVNYRVMIVGSGHALTMTDVLPAELSAPGLIEVVGGNAAAYDPIRRRIEWAGTVAAGQLVTITFPATVTTSAPTAIINQAILTDTVNGSSMSTAIVIGNAYQVWLPVARR